MDFIHATLCSCLPSLSLPTALTPNIKLNNRSLKTLRLLGEGGFSYVYLVQDQQGHLYALKKIRCPFGQESVQLAMREVKAYSHFKHRSVIAAVDHAIVQEADAKIVYILLPYYKLGNLQDAINDKHIKQERFSESEVLSMLAGICLALRQLHEHRPAIDARQSIDEVREPLMNEDATAIQQEQTRDGGILPYAHYDLKPANVMLADDGTPVLMDLGSLKPARRHITTRTEALQVQDAAAEHSTMPYRAPELFDTKTGMHLDERVDIWSLGCLIYALLFLHSPFETPQTEQGSMSLAVLNGAYKIPPGHPYSQQLIGLVQSCLQPLAKDRPSAKELEERVRALM
ncbi:kinase-like domain-containing protein [Protomyces lactucae-debilis]|uniref:non-specific serine/threonine protein kinase n=1 Tax=Protomyces lactucae-debilis TaxID=2754530 RepID=A0A1Y2F8Y0_PROLT|nr:kinase-like domain-containing protein [Protomyces lactucae-debilis]ORY80323.1 kinase-like domain-containing protein [Protomyces lactucae-debilis]